MLRMKVGQVECSKILQMAKVGGRSRDSNDVKSGTLSKSVTSRRLRLCLVLGLYEASSCLRGFIEKLCLRQAISDVTEYGGRNGSAI